ncbi:hypothetical protein HG535_0C05380 [Zygotorulaspora mrakii]|uniref:TAP42-like protein n=1 Tax=Zygotorulaspora mrakii TaxID=42260 RepID=A0A7H9B1C1_ZYGMR|nr:uncharacterized protein HG535_0C05380 [Zygotorulaspora mrakii]QLG72184.1 hypothetical protein HG535_0C05380 [Zygotorulaspora mrakii]
MSIAQEFDLIIKTYNDKIVHPASRQDSPEFQNLISSTIEKLLTLKNTVYTKLSLFSTNETVEDMTTSSLKFLSIDYYLAMLFSRKQVTANQVENSENRNKLKLKFLEKSLQLFMQFIVSLDQSEILDSYLSKKINSFEHTYEPTLKEMYSQPSNKDDLSGAQLKRQQKIEVYRTTKAINEKLAFIESKYKNIDDNDDIDDFQDGEELLRELYLQKLKSLAYDTFDNVEKILYEGELLKNFTRNPEHQRRQPEMVDSSSSSGYTEKLESLNKPLISKEGKVLRNFTLLDKKSELQRKVRGYGQYGPTMSVEEFLEKEWESGRVLQGGEVTQEQSKEDAEDNETLQDIETYKAREWDEFKEANPRGSGNTTNRG